MGVEDKLNLAGSWPGEFDETGAAPDLAIAESVGNENGTLAMPADQMRAAGQSVIEASIASAHEQADVSPERFDSRAARPEDIPAMVEIDFVAFRRVYLGQGRTDEVLRRELTMMFERRLEILGGELMPVVTQRLANGEEQIVGFVHLLRTNKGPDDFVSWEDTTGDGWLADRHDPLGQNLYVVTLSMSPAVAREDAPNLLAARARGLMVLYGCELIYAGSRLPGMRKWVEHQRARAGVALDSLQDEDVAQLAQQYFGLTRQDPDSQRIVPHDPMLAFCVSVGYMPQRLVANAYKDEQSMDYVAVCVIPNPILPQERTVQRVALVGERLLAAAHSLVEANALIFGEVPIN